MLRLREEGLFVDGQAITDAFAGFHFKTGAPGFEQPLSNDGVNFQRKILLAHVAAVPTDGITLAVGSKTYTFKNTVATPVADKIAIANLVTNGDFAAADASWINYGSWTIDATGALHVAGTHTVPVHILNPDDDTFTDSLTVDNVQTLVQEWMPKPIVGYTYTTVYTVTGRSAGSVRVSIGGALGTVRSTNATFTEALVAVSNGDLQFIPTADFDGKVSAVAVTEPHTDILGLQTQAVVNRINLDARAGTACTAYVLENNAYIVLVANVVDASPTFTADGVKVIKDLDWTNYLSKAGTEGTTTFGKLLTDSDTKPTVLVERNAGTDKNFLY